MLSPSGLLGMRCNWRFCVGQISSGASVLTALSRRVLSILAGQADGCRSDSGRQRLGPAPQDRDEDGGDGEEQRGKNSTVRCSVVGSPRLLGV